jgi:hypothetical protein
MTKKPNVRVIQETNLGLYVWEMPDGKWIGDDAGNYLSVPAQQGDRVKMEALKKAAHGYLRDIGIIPMGKPLFLPGRRQISDQEYEDQKARAAAGLVPDPFDDAALIETAKYAKRHDE